MEAKGRAPDLNLLIQVRSLKLSQILPNLHSSWKVALVLARKGLLKDEILSG
jgi:hypothetical protein